MLIISKDQIQSLLAKMGDPKNSVACLEEVQQIKNIKEGLYWRADAGTCCGGPALAGQLFGQIRILDGVLLALGDGRQSEAITLLAEFASDIE